MTVKEYGKMMNKTIEEEDMKNAMVIAGILNMRQCNTEPYGHILSAAQNVMNLSDFGFALSVSEAVPSRDLRLRALKRLREITRAEFVKKQIDEYLEDDHKWDYQVVDNLAFELKRCKEKLIAIESNSPAALMAGAPAP
jgi:hypothetical protein